MNFDYIIVQAGGKGTRMEKLTRNKPKAIVPVNNLPIIMHLFKKYPSKKFIVIGDYKYDVLKRYLHEFANVDYKMIRGTGRSGTCAGINDALLLIPDNARFLLIWCDLILSDECKIPDSENNIIGISKDFPCRWKYKNGRFTEERSVEFGVAGYFIFKDKSYLADIPEEGEFVKWLKEKEYKFEVQPLYKTREYGVYSEWDKLPREKCRPFNSIKINKDKLFKIPIDDQGRKLALEEVAWYKQLKDYNYKNIPTIYSYEPLCMEFIEGKNIYEYNDIPSDIKEKILLQIIICLKNVHAIGKIKADRKSYYDAYIGKTLERLKKVRNLVPFANDEYVIVNNRKCRNIFYHIDEVEKKVMAYFPDEFYLIHGDCTFSNIMLRKDMTPVLIDPRGYFGTTKLYGDVAYDWVKLYYSLFSNYDQFNLKRFNLFINEKDIELQIGSNNWENMEEKFFEFIGEEIDKKQMRLLLAIIWLSLTTYAWEDYDSICGAFYNGLYYLEEVL